MRTITDRNLIGAFIESFNGKPNEIRITENSGEVTVGRVVGYTRGGYLFGEDRQMRKATATIQVEGDPPARFNVTIENVIEVEG